MLELMSSGPTTALVLGANDLETATAKDCLETLRFDDIEYVRFSDDMRNFERGTVLLDGRVVPSYPRLGRIFVLEEGVRRAMPEEFYVEEKLDGYNVRVLRHGERLLPLTRGGFVCPFTEDRLADLADLEPLLRDRPDLIVCAEVVGPENPYILTRTPRVASDVRLFAFDLMRCGHAGFLPLAERDALFERYRVPRAPVLGRWTPAELPRLKDELRRLDAEGAEGIVLKPPAEGLRVKYVTPSVNLTDIEDDSVLLKELPPEFFMNRLVRLALGMREMGMLERTEEIEQRLGHAILTGFFGALEGIAAGGVVERTFRVRMHGEQAAERLMRHMNRASRRIQVREIERHAEDGMCVLSFRKIFLTSTSELKTLLGGQFIFD
jgi:putative ATP-dependent DNA ligase